MATSRIDVDAYLRRIGLAGRPPVDREGLCALQVAHLASVPFENLDILAGRPISLELRAIEAKIVGARRGGFCYELNGLFAALLEELGFRVTRFAAETWSEETGWGPQFDHLVLRVDLAEPWLVDVGFGDAFREPMPLRAGAEQADVEARTFGLSLESGHWLVWVRSAHEAPNRPLYRFDEVPHALDDFIPACRWQATASPFFTGHRIVERSTPAGRWTLYDDRLISHLGPERTERRVGASEFPALLREIFGIDGPGIDALPSSPG